MSNPTSELERTGSRSKRRKITPRRRLELLQSKKDRMTSLDWSDDKIEKHLLGLDLEVDLGDSGRYSLVAKKNTLMRMLSVGVGHSPTLVWYVISDYAYKNSNGECWPSLSTIAKRVGLSRRAVIRRVNHLVELGALERVKRGSARDGATRYQIHTKWNPSYGLGIGGQNSESDSTTPKKLDSDSNGTTDPEIVTPVTSNGDTCGKKMVTQVAHESIYESGPKPGEIDREADTTKPSGAGAPCDLVALPHEVRLSEVIARGWSNLNDRQAGYAKKYLKKRMKEGDTPDQIADGLERHLTWTEARGKEPWNLMSMFRDRKYIDRWETKPQAKKSTLIATARKKPARKKAADKPKTTSKPKPVTAPKAVTTTKPRPKPPTAIPRSSISTEEIAALDGPEAQQLFDKHVGGGQCTICSAGMKKLEGELPGLTQGDVAVIVQSDYKGPGSDRRYWLCGSGTQLIGRLADYYIGDTRDY